VRKRKGSDNPSYDGIGIVVLPLHELASMTEPHTIDGISAQQGEDNKSVVVSMTISAKIISQVGWSGYLC
jgi:hypothetical protein